MTSRRKIFIFIILSVSLFLISCRNSNRFHIDTQKNGIKVHIHRFDKDLINIDTAHTDTEIKKMYGKYPDFFPVFISEILDVAPSDTDSVSLFIHNFLSDTTFAKVNREVLKKFSDVRLSSINFPMLLHTFIIIFPKFGFPKSTFLSRVSIAPLLSTPLLSLLVPIYISAPTIRFISKLPMNILLTPCDPKI
jgi:hypothetical protein